MRRRRYLGKQGSFIDGGAETMTRKYIDAKKVAVVLKIAGYAIEDSDDGMTLNDVYNLLDNAFRTVLGDAVFDDLYNSYLADDDEVEDPETPKF